jgi:hypothetical protein
MPVRKLFFLLMITLWVAEPFLSLATPQVHVHRVCPNCGMEDMCGDVCCCVDARAMCGHLPGFYPAGCTPDNAQNLFAQSAIRFLPSNPPVLFRVDLKRDIAVCFSFLPIPSEDKFSPPPKLEHFV